jgi:carbon monoxide dehydrogenase subunit G
VERDPSVLGRPAETINLQSSPETAWAALDEPEMLCRALPGCDSLERDGPDRFRAVLSSKVAFMTVRVDVVARYAEVDRPRHLRLVMDGSPRGLAGSFHAEIPVDIAAADGGGSVVAYSVAITVEGALRAIAGSAIEDGLRREFAQALRTLDGQIVAGGAATPP